MVRGVAVKKDYTQIIYFEEDVTYDWSPFFGKIRDNNYYDYVDHVFTIVEILEFYYNNLRNPITNRTDTDPWVAFSVQQIIDCCP